MASMRLRPHVVSLFVLALAWAGFQQPVAGQAPAAQQPAAGQPPAAEQTAPYPRLQLTTGRSIVLTPEFDVTRIAITNPAVADATVVQPREILIDGKAPGTISLIIWSADRSADAVRRGRRAADLVDGAAAPAALPG